MKYVYAVVFTLVAHFLLASVALAGEITAYTMNPDWQACSTSGIVDSQKFDNCITYPDSGKDFETCGNPPKAIYFARHAPKRFRDIKGGNNAPDYILTRVGQKMAQHLAKVFKPIPVKMIYTSDWTRTRQTACPLMRSQGINRKVVCKLETKSDRFLQEALCKSHKNEVIVVVGHSDTIDEMLINMKVVGPLDGLKIEHGKLYKVTFKDGKGILEEPPIQYWNCDASECKRNGALNVKLE